MPFGRQHGVSFLDIVDNVVLRSYLFVLLSN